MKNDWEQEGLMKEMGVAEEGEGGEMFIFYGFTGLINASG